jgi:hypothetical protein
VGFPSGALRRLVVARASIAAFGLLLAFGAGGALAAKRPRPAPSCNSSAPSIGGGSVSRPEGEANELPGPMESSILADFAVFRRPAEPSDQLPALNLAGEVLDSQLSSYYPGYVRQLLVLPHGGRYFAIPAFERSESIPSGRCLPPSLRPQRAKLVEEQRRRASDPVYCIVRVGGGREDVAPPDCQPFAEVDRGVSLFASAFSQGPIVGLVPDGVASVRIAYPSGTQIEASVGENAFAFTPPQAPIRRARDLVKGVVRELASGRPAKAKRLTRAQVRRLQKAYVNLIRRALAELEPSRAEWLNAAGAPIRTIARPQPADGAFGDFVAVSTGR